MLPLAAMKVRARRGLPAVLSGALWLAALASGQADPIDEPGPSGLLGDVGDALNEAFSYKLRLINFGELRDIRASAFELGTLTEFNGVPLAEAVNPGLIPDISKYRLESEIRLDLKLNFDRLDMSVKPRAELFWEDFDVGPRAGEKDTGENTYVNAWLVRFRPHDALAVSYGREDLQWGPSYLLSPSNPFDADNGRNSPKDEVPGADYARLVWTPSYEWTASFIVNTDQGRKDVDRDADAAFDDAALTATQARNEQIRQIDKAFNDALAPLQPLIRRSRQWQNRNGPLARRLDSQLTAIWAEAVRLRNAAVREVDAVYDDTLEELERSRELARQEFHPTYALKVDRLLSNKYLSAIVSKTETEDPRVGAFASWNATDALILYSEASVAQDDVEALVGQSYTFVSGPALFLEYFYNDSGDADAPFDRLVPPFRKFEAREVFLRKNYVLAQYVDQDFLDTFDLTLRWTFNLDDQSSLALWALEYEWGDHTRLFTNVTAGFGDSESEFAAVLNEAVMVGFELLF